MKSLGGLNSRPVDPLDPQRGTEAPRGWEAVRHTLAIGLLGLALLLWLPFLALIAGLAKLPALVEKLSAWLRPSRRTILHHHPSHHPRLARRADD